MKFRSKYNHDFTNHGCLHCTILKALYSPKEKDPTGERYAVFPSKCSESNFHDFEQHEIYHSSLLN